MICTPRPISSGDQIEKKEVGEACSAYGGVERRIQGLVWKTEENRPLGRPRRRSEDNTKIDLQEWELRAWNG
jgi:hypothetical protein